MRKNLHFLFLLFLLFSFNAFSQGKKSVSNIIENSFPNIPWVILDNTCDSIAWPITQAQGIVSYSIPDNEGYVSGTNTYGDKAKANFYDLSASSATHVLRAIIGLGYVNTKSSAPDLTRNILVRVYDGSTNTPGAVLGTYTATLEEMRNRRLNFTYVVFPSPIALPASKKIFLGIDFSTLAWGEPSPEASVKDTFSVWSTVHPQPDPTLAWELWSNDNWYFMKTAWSGLSINLHLFPLVSSDINACNTLPVTFGGFTGQHISKGVQLQWTTWTEAASQRFDIERSIDGDKFLTINSVPTKAVNGHNVGYLTYQFTDEQPASGANFYRIKQVDKDGEFSYTKTIKVAINLVEENTIVRHHYPNPAGQHVYIQLAQGIRNVEKVKFTDVNGRMVGAQVPAVSPDGLMKVNTGNLRSGLNFATIELQDGRSATIKVIKE